MMSDIQSSTFFDFAERNGLALHEVYAGDKSPIGDGWQNRPTLDPIVYRGWIATGNNVGLNPGASHLAVMDIEAGKQSIAEQWFLDVTGYALPAAHVKSPSGGTHTYFRLADASGLKSLRMKETGWGDLLVGNANAMCPPSYFTNSKNQIDKKAGPYEWLGNETIYDGEILRPAWRKSEQRSEAPPALNGYRIEEVSWWIDRKKANDSLDWSQEDWAMFGGALKLHFGDDGLELFQRISGDPDQAEQRFKKFSYEYREGNRTLHWYLDRREAQDLDWMWRHCLGDCPKPPPGPSFPIPDEVLRQMKAPTAKPEFTLFDDCATSAPKVWLHKDVMAIGENSSWYGEPGSLKSALMTDIAVHIAAGIDWRGHRIKTRCGVVYFAFERSGQAKRRLAAYRKRDDLHGLPIAVVPRLVDLLNPQCVDLIVGTVERAAEAFGVSVGLIVLDTYNKGIAAGGGDENAAKDQNQAAAHLRLIHERLDVHIAGIGHTGKDTTRGERGSNAREGDVDLAVQIAGDAVKTATVAKANDQEEGDLVSFKGEVVHLGRDEDGDPITAFIVSRAAAVKEAKGGSKLSDREALAMRALHAVRGTAPQVQAEAWREQLKREGVIKSDDTNPRATYTRIRDGLVRKKIISELDGWIVVRPSGALTPLVSLIPVGACSM